MSAGGSADRAEVGYAHSLILPDRAYAGMPGSDDDPDKIQTYGTDNTGKSKTSQPAPEQVGRENARTDMKGGEVDADTVKPGELVDRSSGNRYDVDEAALLAAAGYSSGDVIPLGTFGQDNDVNVSTTSTSFDIAGNLVVTQVPFEDYLPDSAQLVVGVSGRFDPGSGETLSVRVRNADDSTVVQGPTDVTSTTESFFGWTQISKPASPIPTVIFEHKTNPGSNASTSKRVVFHVGVQL